MTFNLATNLSDLPYGVFQQLAEFMDSHNVWQHLLSDDCRLSVYHFLPDDVERYKRMPNAGAHFLRQLGNRGETVMSFLTRLHALAKIYGSVMDRPQLIMRRKFCSVIWSKPEQIVVNCSDKDHLTLQCKASGFPTPTYQWLEEDKALDGATSSTLHILRCPCTARNVFRCKVRNVIEDGCEWSAFYRGHGKKFHSELTSEIVDLSAYVTDGTNPRCTVCNKNSLENICRLVQNMATTAGDNASENGALNDASQMDSMMTTDNIASDKVALIISNRTYAPQMANLITPHCDAEALADALQQLKFKTVTLGDLRIDEMKFIIQEYRKLFGEGVYAVFYFVGHGFEVNGQCYLLPIGAPAENYGPEDCLSMDWVMSIFRDANPALNLIVLDICRKFLPSNLEAYNAYAERFRRDVIKINRNTVYGYATSGGVGAYEVRGEINGVFMKYLKNRINQPLTVLDMLKRVFRDIEKDKKVRDVQIPELRSNLTRPRSLLDPLIFDGHTNSYDHHTMHWRLMHELPTPVHLSFVEQSQLVTVWFDFCGHFTNKVYVFSSVGEIPADEIAVAAAANGNDYHSAAPQTNAADGEDGGSSEAQSYLAYLKFSQELDATPPKICIDDEEGVSLCVMLSNLQRNKGELRCVLELRRAPKRRDDDDEEDEEEEEDAAVVATREVTLGHVLITRLTSSAMPPVA